MSARSKRDGASKAAFVLSLASETPAKEVLALAEAKGIALSESYVYKIRRNALAPKRRASRSPKSDHASITNSTTQSAASFVQSLPAGVSAKEAVRKAAAAGIRLTPGYYYTLRSALGLAGARSGRSPKAERNKGVTALKLSSANPYEQRLLDAVSALGLPRVRDILDAVQKVGRVQ